MFNELRNGWRLSITAWIAPLKNRQSDMEKVMPSGWGGWRRCV